MTGINEVAKEIHENAVAHGWWDEERGFPEVLALIHSEVSEALEEYRNGHGATEIYFSDSGKPEGIPTELADVIIRVLDYCGYAGIDIDAAISQKHEYNKSRPYRNGGKKVTMDAERQIGYLQGVVAVKEHLRSVAFEKEEED